MPLEARPSPGTSEVDDAFADEGNGVSCAFFEPGMKRSELNGRGNRGRGLVPLVVSLFWVSCCSLSTGGSGSLRIEGGTCESSESMSGMKSCPFDVLDKADVLDEVEIVRAKRAAIGRKSEAEGDGEVAPCGECWGAGEAAPDALWAVAKGAEASGGERNGCKRGST